MVAIREMANIRGYDLSETQPEGRLPMRGRHRSYDDLIALERERQRQSRMREADMRARQKKEGRTRETRRKVLLGVAVQKHLSRNPGYQTELREIVRAGITDLRDQLALPEYFPEAQTVPSPPDRPPRDSKPSPGGSAPA
jgi:hypothetical protein